MAASVSTQSTFDSCMDFKYVIKDNKHLVRKVCNGKASLTWEDIPQGLELSYSLFTEQLSFTVVYFAYALRNRSAELVEFYSSESRLSGTHVEFSARGDGEEDPWYLLTYSNGELERTVVSGCMVEGLIEGHHYGSNVPTGNKIDDNCGILQAASGAF
jgi:hypothetical protein